jgi:hypothetical protein
VVASIEVLVEGYARSDDEATRVAGTVSLARVCGRPRATDLDALHAGRARVLEVAHVIVPGHGPAFEVSESTPR